MWWLLLAVLGAHAVAARVHSLDPTNFKERVLDSRTAWFVMFSHQRCVKCMDLIPDFSQAARDVPEINFAIVDTTGYPEFLPSMDIKELPRMHVYAPFDKSRPIIQPGWRSDSEPKHAQFAAFARGALNPYNDGLVFEEIKPHPPPPPKTLVIPPPNKTADGAERVVEAADGALTGHAEDSSPAGDKSTLDHEKRKYSKSGQPARTAAAGKSGGGAIADHEEDGPTDDDDDNSETAVESEDGPDGSDDASQEEEIDEPPYDDYAEFLAKLEEENTDPKAEYAKQMEAAYRLRDDISLIMDSFDDEPPLEKFPSDAPPEKESDYDFVAELEKELKEEGDWAEGLDDEVVAAVNGYVSKAKEHCSAPGDHCEL